MIYHYIAWSFPNLMSPDSLLSVLGYYGVAAFFVISGVSLAIAYDGRLANRTEIARFLSRRLFRIAPLYWLTVSATILLAIVAGVFTGAPLGFTWGDIAANYLLTFSFGLSPSLVVGGWSIGNEIFFYLCFPVLFWLICKSISWALTAIVGGSVLLALWAFIVVPSGLTDQDEWTYYISNWNQLFFFIAGVVIGRYIKPASFSRTFCYVTLVAALAMLAMANVGTRSDLVEHWHRIFLSIATLLLVFSVYQINWQSTSFIGQALAFLGLISYSLYLLHPLVRSVVNIIGNQIGLTQLATLIISVALTVVGSWISYKLIEMPGIRLGKTLERSLTRRITATA